MKIPFLKKGDTIAIATPSRKAGLSDFELFENYLAERGFKTVRAGNIFLSDNQFAGNDSSRIEAMNNLIEDKKIKAIVAVRGGYGAVRIVDKLNWDTLSKNPKWLCGFSDFTVLLNHNFAHNRLPAIHSDMAVHYGLKEYESNFEKLIDLLIGKPLELCFSSHPLNKYGEAEGVIVGGNLSVMYSLLASKSFPDTKGKILFLEDLDEYLYHIDRMIVGLKRAKVFDGVAGVVVGSFSEMRDNEISFGKNAEEIIYEHLSEFSFPLIFGFPAGHTSKNHPFYIGAETKIKTRKDISEFRQHL